MSPFFMVPPLRGLTAPEMDALVAHFTPLHHPADTNVLMGDFNFIDHPLDKGRGLGTRDKMFCDRWKVFTTASDLADPFRVQRPDDRLYSYVASGGRSRVDRVYVNQAHAHLIANLTYHHSPFPNTHKILSFSFQSQTGHGPGYWKMNVSLLKDPPYVALVRSTISDLEGVTDLPPDEWWDLLLLALRSITLEYSTHKRRVERGVKKRLEVELSYLESLPLPSLSPQQLARLHSVQARLRLLLQDQIEGHRVRTRQLPKYEFSEPDLSFYADLEKRTIRKTVIGSLRMADGQVASDPPSLLSTTSSFYHSLYTPSPTSRLHQNALLNNISSTITSLQRQTLDAPLTLEELQTAVDSLNDDKSPGISGFPAEFYKCFWPLLQHRYLQLLNHAFHHSFPPTMNTSVTTLIYKDKGSADDLINYRPISLINTDLKILSKALTTRLKPILPHIIHKSQTAVDGRRIDHNLHLVRDLIDLSNTENLDAAFIFLDQEKAFDRVDHQFLYRTLQAFGFGDTFIHWLSQMYASASTRVKVNGFLTDSIPLRRGVRQGDPLSFYLYLFNIELLALQLRSNPNIVGFTVGGEKIVSMHYADDTTITITQNRCFKEVIKDLSLFQSASGAKINLGKTTGLWVGAWKHRQDAPLAIEWTSSNVYHLGVYVGNEDPAKSTFDAILPKILKSLDYWKPFRLSTFAKARVIEIFHASQLWYAAKIYRIPPSLVRLLHEAFLSYINFPHKNTTITQSELHRLRLDGGAKLVHIQHKSEASKIDWLVNLCVNPTLSLHKALVERLLGTHKGDLSGLDLMFTTRHYARKIMKVPSLFYKEALWAVTLLHVRKKVLDPRAEKLFYNPTFLRADGRTLTPNNTCLTHNITTYGQLLDEVALRTAGVRHRRHIASLFDLITTADLDGRGDYFLHTHRDPIPFSKLYQHHIYEALLRTQVYRDHHSTAKWVQRLNAPVDWDRVWQTVHQPLAREGTKSLVWAQLHLNNYTTASYNRWHKASQPCPLCLQPIDDQFHLILSCPTTVALWRDLHPFLTQLHSAPITPDEMAFGLFGHTPRIHLRNWLTFLLRESIADLELKAYHNHLGPTNMVDLKHTYNARVKREVCEASSSLAARGRPDLFLRRYVVGDAFAQAPDGSLSYSPSRVPAPFPLSLS